MRISHLDHLVVPVSDIEQSVDFYVKNPGMTVKRSESGRRSHCSSDRRCRRRCRCCRPANPNAEIHLAGTADLCFIIEDPISDVHSALETQGLKIIEGPVRREGAVGDMISIYFRDPDGNLIELSNYL